MSLARTTLLQAASLENHGTGVYTSGSFTPANNCLLLVTARAQSESNDAFNGASITINPSAGTATAIQNTTTSPGSWSYGIRQWQIPITTGVSMTIQLDGGAFNVHQYKLEVEQFTGHDVASPIGALANTTDADGDGAGVATLSGAPAATSIVVASAEVALNAALPSSVTPAAGWTEIYDVTTANWSISQSQVRTGSTSTSVDWQDLDDDGTPGAGAVLVAVEIKQSSATAATLSAPTPSGTLGTQFTATLGATTDQTSGTFYTVVDSAANLSGVTATQIKAGQKASGAAALASGNVAVSTANPSVGVSGLSAGTLYSYASVQNNTNGDSNIVTGTFTTAAAPPTILLGQRKKVFVANEVIQN